MEKEQSRAGFLLLIVILSVPGFPPCAASHSFFIPLGSSDLESSDQYNDDTLSFVLVNFSLVGFPTARQVQYSLMV